MNPRRSVWLLRLRRVFASAALRGGVVSRRVGFAAKTILKTRPKP
jgi:hypothetical protein